MNITISVSNEMCFEPSILRESMPQSAFANIDTFVEHLKYYIARKGVLCNVTTDRLCINLSEAAPLYNDCVQN